MKRRILFIISFAFLSIFTNGQSIFDENSDNKLKLDSIIWDSKEKKEYQYNNSGKLIQEIFSNFNEENDSWIYNYKNEYDYDDNHCLIKQERINWDNLNNRWSGDFKYIFGYDNHNRRILSELYNFDQENNTFMEVLKDEYTYDEYGNEVLYHSYRWHNDDWFLNNKKEYAFNENGEKTLEIDLHYYVNECHGEKIEKTFDDNNNNILTIKYVWDNDINDWKEYFKNEKSFDSSNNTLQSIESTNYYWENISYKIKNEFEYNTSNKLIKSIKYKCSESNNNWENVDKCEYTYNNQGNNTKKIDYIWELNPSSNEYEWINHRKSIYNYNTSNNIILNEIYRWNYEISDWILKDNYEYEFDDNGNEILELRIYYGLNWDDNDYEHNHIRNGSKSIKEYDQWRNLISVNYYRLDNETDLWYLTSIAEFEYNENGEMLHYSNLTSRQIIIDGQQQTVFYGSKLVYTYDELGNTIFSSLLNWDYNTEDWVGNDKEERNYNNNYQIYQLVVPEWYNEENNSMINQFTRYLMDLNTNEWAIQKKLTYYYSEQNLSIADNITKNIFQIYPNPAADNINIIIPEELNSVYFTLYDINGKELNNAKLSGENKLSLDNLTNGIYFYKITSNSVVQTGK